MPEKFNFHLINFRKNTLGAVKRTFCLIAFKLIQYFLDYDFFVETWHAVSLQKNFGNILLRNAL